jgi:hypothetical protein
MFPLKPKVGKVHQKGSDIKSAKLLSEDVAEIKRQLALALVDDGTAARLARIYKVSQSTIASIKAGRTWAWLEVEKPIDQRQIDLFSGDKQ